MPTLNWIGKDKIVNHHRDVPFHTLQHEYNYNSDTVSENKIIQGDNLLALKSLLPEYEGRIKCIYIDPPYNTGNEGWVYNDNVSDPRLKRWLDKVVGKEGEDLSRHDKWLCMMYPRLQLLRRLLADDGAIFISIDDNEQANLKLMCDEIFGGANFINNIIWQKKYSPQNDAKYLSDMHDFILCYTKNKNNWNRNLSKRTDEQNARYKNLDNDPRGVWKSSDLSVKTYSKDYDYPIETPSGKIINPPQGRCWRTSKTNFFKLVEENRIYFGKNGDNVPSIKRFLTEVQDGTVPVTLWLRDEVGDNQEARQILKQIFSEADFPFDTPKPPRLIEKILRLATNPNDLILDSFAGSGTTAHAVLNLNAKDGGNRKFILVEMNDYAETITAERVRRVIQNGQNAGRVLNPASVSSVNDTQLNAFSENVGEVQNLADVGSNDTIQKQPASFSYYSLGEKLFDPEFGDLNEAAPLSAIQSYIWYSETLMPYEATPNGYYLGEHYGTGYVFAYEKEATTVLDENFLAQIEQNQCDKYIIYADICLLPDYFLRKQGIVFKKIPRQITRI